MGKLATVLSCALLLAVAGCSSSKKSVQASAPVAPTTSLTIQTLPSTTVAPVVTTGAPAGGAATVTKCAPAGDISTATSTNAYTLDEFKITGPAQAKAGPLGLALTNAGKGSHSIDVIKADNFDGLPKNVNGTIDEAKLPSGAVVGKVAKFSGGGQTCSGVFTLAAGNYVLVCNIEFINGPTIISHAGRGMHLNLQVTA